MLTVALILAIAALLIAIWSAVRPAQNILWIAVVLLSIIHLVGAALR
jgi:uncharacterized membrane protein YjdF